MFVQKDVTFDDISNAIPRVGAQFWLTYDLEAVLLGRNAYASSQRLLLVLLPGCQQVAMSPPKEGNQAKRPGTQVDRSWCTCGP